MSERNWKHCEQYGSGTVLGKMNSASCTSESEQIFCSVVFVLKLDIFEIQCDFRIWDVVANLSEEA